MDKPVKELKAFQKVYLQPSESKTIEMVLTKEDLASYDIKLGQFVTEPGTFDILLGTSSNNIVLEASFEAECHNPYGVSENMEIAKLVVEPRAMEVIHKYLPTLDLKKEAGSYVVFNPFMPFKEIWGACVVPWMKDLSQEQQDNIYHAIIKDFEKLH